MSTWTALPTEIKLVILNHVLHTIIDEAVMDYPIMFTDSMVRRGQPKLTALRHAFPEMSSYLYSFFRRELVTTEGLKQIFEETIDKKYGDNYQLRWKLNEYESHCALWYRVRALQELVSLC